MKNDTPIAAVNVRAKIVSSVYYNRITVWLARIIPRTQAGSMRGHMDEKIVLHDFMSWSKWHSEKSMLLSLDFGKGYGRVKWTLLPLAIRKMHFGPVLQNFVSKSYYKRRTEMLINGRSTNVFEISRVGQQGPHFSISCCDLDDSLKWNGRSCSLKKRHFKDTWLHTTFGLFLCGRLPSHC